MRSLSLVRAARVLLAEMAQGQGPYVSALMLAADLPKEPCMRAVSCELEALAANHPVLGSGKARVETFCQTLAQGKDIAAALEAAEVAALHALYPQTIDEDQDSDNSWNFEWNYV
ncbi:MAG TPA: hypothetical protein VFA15_02625 [Nitrososphaera sp.]|nr:hypothetical protein [Nitrososphaera sp.]